jgi:hypothetical protein
MVTATKTATPVKLTEPQRKLVDDLERRLNQILAKIHSSRAYDSKENQEMGALAASLHKSLKESGVVVRHHKYMIENRGKKPDDPGFYEHVHPVEDLLKFIRNQAANDDPEDQTIGHEFRFDVYSRRWGHDDTYRVIRTETGWVFQHMMGPIPTGKDGRVGGRMNSGLFDMLDHDSINYPEELPGYLQWLWERAAENGLTHDQAQEGITALAEWVSIVEKSSPGGIFEHFK